MFNLVISLYENAMLFDFIALNILEINILSLLKNIHVIIFFNSHTKISVFDVCLLC